MFDLNATEFMGRPIAYDKAGNPISMRRYGELRCADNEDYMRIGYDVIGATSVSTVWLGINHRFGPGPPLIFETMAFTLDGEADVIDRYATEQQARQGHMRTVNQLRTEAGRN